MRQETSQASLKQLGMLDDLSASSTWLNRQVALKYKKYSFILCYVKFK